MIMINPNQTFLWLIAIVRLIVAVNITNPGESSAREFLESLNKKSAQIASKLVSAQWEFEINNNENTKKELFQITSDTIKNAKIRFHNVVNTYPWNSYFSPEIRRQLKLFSEIGILALPNKEYEQFQKIISDLDLIRQNTTICDYFNKTKCDLHLNPDIKEKLQTSQNPDELSYLWTEWRRVTESEFVAFTEDYVKLCNHAAQLHNYTNFKEYSLRNIESDNIKQDMISLWEDIKHLYKQIHAYVRRKLRDVYGETIVPQNAPIPAYLLGNLWSEDWSGIAHKMLPYPELDNLNITDAMIKQNFTSDFIHSLAENFFTSMNFSGTSHLWDNDDTQKCDKRKSKDLHPKIFNFFNDSIRIKDCGDVSVNNFLMANRLMTKAEYMLHYSHQPYIYQSPADSGLEKALKDVITMSISTFKNFKRLGLYVEEINKKVRLNRLFQLALEKVTLIPFLLVQELWRWEVYSGKPIQETSCMLSELREKFQGISTFTKELTFDPGGTGSIFSKLSFVHHFLGYFLEFQIYESLCKMTNSTNQNQELDECNLYGNTEAGSVLRNIMSLGSSMTLMETLKPILGKNKISSQSLITYFGPLIDWLQEENEKNDESMGWQESEILKEICPTKVRRRRSLDFLQDDKEYDRGNEERQPGQFQKLAQKRSDNEFAKGEREKKNSENDRQQREEKSVKEKNELSEDVDEAVRKPLQEKTRRSYMNINKNDNNKDSEGDDEKENEGSQKTNKFATKSKKRHVGSENYNPNYDASRMYARDSNREDTNSLKRKESDEEGSRANGNIIIGDLTEKENAKNDVRFVRKTRKQQRRYASDRNNFYQNHEIWRRRDKNQYLRPSRRAEWHTDTKKDISRLLHSFGFTVENDEKEKIKELKKKLKGETNSDLKSNVALKDTNVEGMIDFAKMKEGDGRSDTGEEKGNNKLWSVKSYYTDNGKIIQSPQAVEKKDIVVEPHLTNAMLTHGIEEKSMGKKESLVQHGSSLASLKEKSGDTLKSGSQDSEAVRGLLNLDLSSLKDLLKNADLTAFAQQPIYALNSEVSESKLKSDIAQTSNLKSENANHASFISRYAPKSDTLHLKEKKEYKDDAEKENVNKSPYVIILGQLTPDIKEKLMQEKGLTILETDKQSQLQSLSTVEGKKLSDKNSRSSEQIYVVPINLKSIHNLLKQNHFAERELEAEHDPNTERDQESENEKFRLEDNMKIDDSSSFYKTDKDNPSEFIISWNDKSRKLVKRSKRDHLKDSDEKLKMVRISPMKDTILQNLLGKSLDRAGLDENNVKILLNEGLMNGEPDLRSALTAPSSLNSGSPYGSGREMDQSQVPAAQAMPSLTSLASSVLSALSPKGLQQVSKTASSHQNSELEEDSLKENGLNQALGGKDQKEQELPFLVNQGLRCNPITVKKKGEKLYDEDTKKVADNESATRDSPEKCCKKIILSPCPPKCPCPCPMPTCPPPNLDSECCKRIMDISSCKPENCDPTKKPSECSLVNAQFKITKAKKPHERLTIMIYDRINPPSELPEPYDALALITEILQRIQCCQNKPSCQLTEEDPDYPANDNSDQLKGPSNQQPESKVKMQELSGEMPILGGENPEEDETDDSSQNSQNSASSGEEDKYQSKEKATPALDQLTVFNKDKLKPVFIELRKIDDLIKKRSQHK